MCSITYKIDQFNEDGTWLYFDEFESAIADIFKMEEILKKLGFEELVRIENIKSTFINNKYEVVLEDVKDLGLFLEVERRDINHDEDIVAVKKEIWKWIQDLGIKGSLELIMGKPELMLRKKRYFGIF